MKMELNEALERLEQNGFLIEKTYSFKDYLNQIKEELKEYGYDEPDWLNNVLPYIKKLYKNGISAAEAAEQLADI